MTRPAMVIPSPIPSGLVVKNGSKSRTRTSPGMPGPVSRTVNSPSPDPVPVTPTVSVPPVDRVLHEGEDGLAERAGISPHSHRRRIVAPRDLDPGRPGPLLDGGQTPVREVAEGEAAELQRPRQAEPGQLRDQRGELVHRARDLLGQLAPLGSGVVKLAGEEERVELQRPERVLELVGHVVRRHLFRHTCVLMSTLSSVTHSAGRG